MSDFTKISLTDSHIRVIITALNCFYRLRSGQIGIAMDEAYRDKDISYEDREVIEKMVRTIAFKEIQHTNSYYGFNHPELKDGTLAFEIEKTLEEYISVKNNGGLWGSGCNFHGPIKATKEPLPVIEGFTDYKDFPLNKEQTSQLLPHYKAKNYNKLWEAYDSLKLSLPKGDKTEIIVGKFNGDEAEYGGSNERVVVRITKPIKD